jgi:arabinogalactan oligomer/maltooligosaccharide transport system permease protein
VSIKNKKIKSKENTDFYSPYTMKNAITKGDIFTKIAMLVMGFGNVARKQIGKGIFFLFFEVAYILFMIKSGIYNLSMLPSLGGTAQEKVWSEAKGIFIYTEGDNSLLLLLYGMATILLTVGFLVIWVESVKSAYKAQCNATEGVHNNNLIEDLTSLFDENLHKLLLAGPLTGILAFTVIPLIFMISMAFTNYSKDGDHLILFDWVGLQNFIKVLNFNDSIGQTFWSVLGWTIIWAIFATGLNYIMGMILAIIINRRDTRLKSFWRFCFVLSIAIPQFVSLLIMRTMLQPNGAVNVLLKSMGVIQDSLPFLTDATWARVTVIVVNLWVGIPFTMLQVTGILQNIPVELYESAKVDGANAAVTFFRITLPYMLFVTTPYLITQFTGNVNNFNVIYLLSAGNPTPVGSTAGKTDLLVTWLYKLTVDQQYYNIGAVIGIFTFVVLAVFSLVAYRSTGSYKNEEEFQ